MLGAAYVHLYWATQAWRQWLDWEPRDCYLELVT